MKSSDATSFSWPFSDGHDSLTISLWNMNLYFWWVQSQLAEADTGGVL